MLVLSRRDSTLQASFRK
ncbi:rCG32775 [Rattus norvegicus]|uniref:RCG32775 n=1 Tax=Rattus norvegicus TaxID=10116 RepID=A6HGB3_RAT|nr:rCG32775 [Rattus norvegicus]